MPQDVGLHKLHYYWYRLFPCICDFSLWIIHLSWMSVCLFTNKNVYVVRYLHDNFIFCCIFDKCEKKENYVYTIIASIWLIMTYTISLKAKKKKKIR